MATVLLGVVALFFLGMGLFGLVAPAALIKPFGIELNVPEARTEVRAVYGGFGVATAVLLVVAAANSGGLRDGIAVSIAAALAGMAFGRLVARLADRPSRCYPTWFYFWVEIAGSWLLTAAAVLD